MSKLVGALCTQVDEALEGDAQATAGGTMAQMYSVLSDNTHPNMSAGHLSITFDAEEFMEWLTNYEWDAGALHEVLGTCFLALHFASVAFDEMMQALNGHPLVLADKRKD